MNRQAIARSGDRQRWRDRQTASTASTPGGSARTASSDRQVATARSGEAATPPGPPAPLAVPPAPRREVAAATHHIVASPDRQDHDRRYDDGQYDDRQGGWLAGLRFAYPGGLPDQIEYARDGAYSVRVDGWWRNANIWFARLVAVPGLILCYLIAWAFFTRLPRTFASLVIAPLLFMLLNSFPVTNWFVPDWADFTTWLQTPAPAPAPGGVG